MERGKEDEQGGQRAQGSEGPGVRGPGLRSVTSLCNVQAPRGFFTTRENFDKFLSSRYKKKFYYLEVLPGTKLFNIYSRDLNKYV